MGYKEVPQSLQPENYLKTAEMCTEQNHNMIDGIMNNSPTVAGLKQRQRPVAYQFDVALKKLGNQAIGISKGGWNTKLHVVSADYKVIVEMHLSGVECHDEPEGRISIADIGMDFEGVPILMDRAHEGDETRALATANGHSPIVPPKKSRTNPWEYDREKYKRRSVVERLF